MRPISRASERVGALFFLLVCSSSRQRAAILERCSYHLSHVFARELSKYQRHASFSGQNYHGSWSGLSRDLLAPGRRELAPVCCAAGAHGESDGEAV
jgi:hypothetical protein